MNSVTTVILADAMRMQIFLKRHFYGHQQWMLPSMYSVEPPPPFSETVSVVLSHEGILLPRQQIEQQGAPIAWLYPTKEMQTEDPYLENQLITVSLLTVVPQPLLASLPGPVQREYRFWPVHALPENLLTEHALVLLSVLFAESRQALPIDMRRYDSLKEV